MQVPARGHVGVVTLSGNIHLTVQTSFPYYSLPQNSPFPADHNHCC